MEKKTYKVMVQTVYTKAVYIEATSEDEARDYVEGLACTDDTFLEYKEDDDSWYFEEDWFVEEAE